MTRKSIDLKTTYLQWSINANSYPWHQFFEYLIVAKIAIIIVLGMSLGPTNIQHSVFHEVKVA
jgi:hypothetical protein